jgi:hypothetical protein
MKGGRTVGSVEELCGLLRRSRLMTAAEVQALAQRWQAEAGDPASLPAFCRWLAACGALTESQVGRLLRGRDDHPAAAEERTAEVNVELVDWMADHTPAAPPPPPPPPPPTFAVAPEPAFAPEFAPPAHDDRPGLRRPRARRDGLDRRDWLLLLGGAAALLAAEGLGWLLARVIAAVTQPRARRAGGRAPVAPDAAGP